MIKVERLTKKFGDNLAVDDVSFTAKPGSVTGFLGPNGAGKSTTLRCIVGLTRPDSGTSSVLGRDYRTIANPGVQVGVLLDSSAMHPGRSGFETLMLSALTIGASKARVQQMLDLVKLDKYAARKRVKAYSLGMRQRLGIALALLGSPEVLILDEPANGLDPMGIAWMRGLLRNFADNGGTVLLSSHLLHEVEQIADQLVLINNGQIKTAGPKAQLLAGGNLESLFLNMAGEGVY
ncbi:MAG: ABC transporter [Actinomycetales bacterium]|nr:MAG: ABC transporter [Actinomycetales bacterium]